MLLKKKVYWNGSHKMSLLKININKTKWIKTTICLLNSVRKIFKFPKRSNSIRWQVVTVKPKTIGILETKNIKSELKSHNMGQGRAKKLRIPLQNSKRTGSKAYLMMIVLRLINELVVESQQNQTWRSTLKIKSAIKMLQKFLRLRKWTNSIDKI